MPRESTAWAEVVSVSIFICIFLKNISLYNSWYTVVTRMPTDLYIAVFVSLNKCSARATVWSSHSWISSLSSQHWSSPYPHLFAHPAGRRWEGTESRGLRIRTVYRAVRLCIVMVGDNHEKFIMDGNAKLINSIL